MSCRTVGPWLQTDSEHLSEADRLVLEEHLQTCERCRDVRAHLALVRRIGTTLPATPLGPRGHQRVIAAALLRGLQPPTPVVARPIWRFAIAGVAAVVAIVVVALVARDRGSAGEIAEEAPPLRSITPAPEPRLDTNAPKQPEPPPAQRDRVVVEGDLEVDGKTLDRDADVPTNVTIRARGISRLRVFETQVVIAAASQIVVRDRTIVVLRGNILVTPADGVQRRIDAGGTWPSQSEPKRVRSAVDDLQAAHAAYRIGDFAKAERSAAAALASRPTVAQAAEADTVIADCRQAIGSHADALVRYEAIASKYPSLAAGEMALFAAARLAGRTAPTRAQPLYERYLARYPQGRFASDARRALEGTR